MLATEDLFVHVYVLVDDAIRCGAVAIASRPGPRPACSDGELITIALVRHLLGRRSECGFFAEVARDWPHLFPCLPHHSEVNRRLRWLTGAFEQLRCTVLAALPVDEVQQIDTSALPVKHPSRVRGTDWWVGPNGLHARFGRDGAHAEWFYGFRLAVRTDLGTRIVRSWCIVPAAIDERTVAGDLLAAPDRPAVLLADKGLAGRAFAAEQATAATSVIVPPRRTQRASTPTWLLTVIACWRNRVETTFAELTDHMELARHGAHTFAGLLARTSTAIAAHTLLRAGLLQ